MNSNGKDDTSQTTLKGEEHVSDISNHHTKKGHSRESSIGSHADMDIPNKDHSHTEKTPVYEKLKGLFRSRSSAGSKTNPTPQIKISMHPEGQDDKTMSQKDSRSTKLSLDSHEADGESDTDFEIPSDGNLYSYSVDNMMQFFKYLNFDEKIIKSLQKRKVDGRRFSKMTDEDLKKYGLDNPIVVYFKSKCEKKRESANLFML